MARSRCCWCGVPSLRTIGIYQLANIIKSDNQRQKKIKRKNKKASIHQSKAYLNYLETKEVRVTSATQRGTLAMDSVGTKVT